MQDIIEPIIHKAAVCDLTMTLRTSGLSINDPAELRLSDDDRVAVYARTLKRSFFIRRSVLRHLGYLGASATVLLTPILRRGDHLRVRIVGLTPEHLASDGQAEMHVSVWGTARHFYASKPPAPAAKPAPTS
jgi:hypothetical protein